MNKNIGKYPNISELILNNNTRILSLSDIHGDIHSLIIALRDCGEVIKKENFIHDKEDSELERLLKIDISDEDNGYIDTLNYNWIGNNTHVVIIGDFLDINRNRNSIINNIEYPQIEIKIFRFINAINKLAVQNGGRIIKMFGNHEIYNIMGKRKFIKKYSFPKTFQLQNYYRQCNRVDCFMYGNVGYTLMLEDGMYIFFKINNNLFVHGGPTNNFDFNDYNEINNIINNNKDYHHIKTEIKKFCNFNSNLSPLWTRIFGNFTLINKRIYDNEEFCNNVKQILIKIKGNGYFNDDIKKLRIIVGHCVQSLSTIFNNKNITFNYINTQKTTNIKEVLEPNLEKINNDDKRSVPNKLTLIDEYKSNYLKDKYNIDYLADSNKLIINNNNNYDVKYRGFANLEKRIVFGITMECDNDLNSADNYIYKVDVGTSRGFDSSLLPTKEDIEQLSNEELENKYYLSRTPQILEIQNDKPKIIRSLLRNTKIHQPRKYENVSKNENEDQSNKHNQINYKYENKNENVDNYKYEKYKYKYINLLKNIYLLYY
jgi:hypothetical protein